jgi:hypothetical protein
MDLILNVFLAGAGTPKALSVNPDFWDHADWLADAVDRHPNHNFFYTTLVRQPAVWGIAYLETSTDIFEDDFDYNTIVLRNDDGEIAHTYSSTCPDGCVGHLPECVYVKEEQRRLRLLGREQ